MEEDGPYTAVVAGATGAVGRDVIARLVASDRCKRVTALVRDETTAAARLQSTCEGRSIAASSKLVIKAVDWESIASEEAFSETWKNLVAGHNLAFNCLGTTKNDAGSEDGFDRVDFDYCVAFAKACKSHGTTGYAHMSSDGADPTSIFHYLKIKGQADNAVGNLRWDQCVILRPGLLARGDVARPIEKAMIYCCTKGFPPSTVAGAIVSLFESSHHEYIGGSTSVLVANESKMRAWLRDYVMY